MRRHRSGRRNARITFYDLLACDAAFFAFLRDIAKNSLLRWPIFIYWTILGVYDAVVMFFGAYFLFDNTSFTSNGQVLKTSEEQQLIMCSTSNNSFSPRILFDLCYKGFFPEFLF